MIIHGYEEEQITYKVMEGYTHAQYFGEKGEDGHYPYAAMLGAYINEMN
jgi:hypothetical protein